MTPGAFSLVKLLSTLILRFDSRSSSQCVFYCHGLVADFFDVWLPHPGIISCPINDTQTNYTPYVLHEIGKCSSLLTSDASATGEASTL
ncbi:hypothetical protein EDB19DRAFT_1743043 [Suillus lakei]|nr:hypothetical protein EDB19DRAFT_1743043 [Suillus lakei]